MGPAPDPDEHALGPAHPQDVARMAAVVAGLLEQQNRESSAARAQGRELVRAIEELGKSHEFLGIQLREERKRTRWAMAALVLVPLVLLAAGAVLWSQTQTAFDDHRAYRADVDKRLAGLQSAVEKDRADELRAAFDEKTGALAQDLTATKADLEASRTSLAQEREDRRRRDEAVTARLAQADKDREESMVLRAELKSLSATVGAERERTRELERAAAAAPPPTVVKAAAPAEPSAPTPVVQEAPHPTPPLAAVAPPAPASRDPGDVERVRAKINLLLEGTTGSSRYQIDSLDGVSGLDLLGVKIVARDEAGKTLRTVEAPRAEIQVSPEGGVRILLRDGHLLLGSRKAPFFDGTYAISLASAVAAWKDSGLTCIRFAP